jgi:hypothetical protein
VCIDHEEVHRVRTHVQDAEPHTCRVSALP